MRWVVKVKKIIDIGFSFFNKLIDLRGLDIIVDIDHFILRNVKNWIFFAICIINNMDFISP